MGPDRARAWYVISLRPQGTHAALRQAAARYGAGLIALSPWKLVAREGADAREQLRQALQADVVLFTSPAAVRFAAAMQPLAMRAHQAWIATGSGTRAALARHGIEAAIAPERMDSEGLLALPALSDLARRSVGLVTAPDGRGLLAPALQARGAQLHLAQIYLRQPLPVSATGLQRLRELKAPAWVALTSAGALRQVLQQLPDEAQRALLARPAVAASARLMAAATDAGFAQVVQAQGPRPAQLVRAGEALLSSCGVDMPTVAPRAPAPGNRP